MKGKFTILFLSLITVLAILVHSEKKVSLGTDDIARRFADEPRIDSLITDYLKEINPDSIKYLMQGLVNFKTRFMLADNRRDISVWIKDRFEFLGYTDVVIDSFQNTLEFPPGSKNLHATGQYNVIATLKGIKNPDDIYILGAHYDCFIMGPETDPFKFSPGANNNASGVAACLEIARVMKKKDFKPKSSIKFIAFGAEEFMTLFVEGKSGSEHYVNQISKSNQTIRLMIDNNQISYSPPSEMWKLDFQNYPGSEWVTDLAHSICEKYTKITPVDTNDHINYTDAYYFWKTGYPAIFFEEFHFNPYTFTEKDVMENCNVAYCAEVTKISGGVLVYCNY